MNEQARQRKLDRAGDDFGRNGGFWGCGVGFRGSFFASAEDQAHGVETRTRWITLFYVPIVPLGTYRLRRLKDVVSGRGRLTRTFVLMSQEPLAWGQVVRVWALWFAIALVVVAGSLWWVQT